MIKDIRHKGLRDLFELGATNRVDARLHEKVIDLLDMLDAATGVEDLAGVCKFHALSGNRKGQYAMRVTGNWRLVFGFDGQDVTEVDFEDYH